VSSAGVDGGATISVDGGKSWTQQMNQPTAQFYHVAADNRFPYYLFGAQQTTRRSPPRPGATKASLDPTNGT